MTAYTFDRNYKYGEAAMFSDLDPNGEYTEAEYGRLRDVYSELVTEKLATLDPSLIWLPATSEILCTDETQATVDELRELWEAGFELEWLQACMTVDAEREAEEE